MNSSSQGETGAALNEDELQLLREKTRAVEEAGMRIDDAIKVCQDTETIITKLGRFNELTFEQAKAKKMTEAQVKKLIHETS